MTKKTDYKQVQNILVALIMFSQGCMLIPVILFGHLSPIGLLAKNYIEVSVLFTGLYAYWYLRKSNLLAVLKELYNDLIKFIRFD